MDHADDCAASSDEECRPAGVVIWDQPDGYFVTEAEGRLVDPPWCRVHHLAWELQDEHDRVDRVGRGGQVVQRCTLTGGATLSAAFPVTWAASTAAIASSAVAWSPGTGSCTR